MKEDKIVVVDVRYEVPIGKLQEFSRKIYPFGNFVDVLNLNRCYNHSTTPSGIHRNYIPNHAIIRNEAIKNKVIKFLFNNELSTKELFNKIKNKFPLSYKSFSRFLMKMVVSQDLQVRTTHKNGCKNIYCLYKNKNRVEVDE